jgi:hypothetical protein
VDFNETIKILNKILADKNPFTFSSSWVLKHAPRCYRFIHKNIRTETNHIDWDKVTLALERKFQRRWMPRRKPDRRALYEDLSEVNAILNKYRDKLYVFLAASDLDDRRIRNLIAISLVRLAQRGNLSAKQEIVQLARYTIDDWIARYRFMSRWEGYDEEIKKHLDGCIRRYRYTGSFLNYLLRTLQYAGRGLRPLYAYSVHEPVTFGSRKCKIENVYKDAETNKILIHTGKRRVSGEANSL